MIVYILFKKEEMLLSLSQKLAHSEFLGPALTFNSVHGIHDDDRVQPFLLNGAGDSLIASFRRHLLVEKEFHAQIFNGRGLLSIFLVFLMEISCLLYLQISQFVFLLPDLFDILLFVAQNITIFSFTTERHHRPTFLFFDAGLRDCGSRKFYSFLEGLMRNQSGDVLMFLHLVLVRSWSHL